LNPGGTALVYATYIGGSSLDTANAIAVDGSGNAFITGYTYSSDFPVVFSGTSSYVAAEDAFLTKVDSGGAISASRYLVGPTSTGTGIAVDSGGSAYVTGTTESATFPVTTGSFMTSKPNGSGLSTGFVAKLDASLNVIYGTYLGGGNTDSPAAIAIDAIGQAYVVGTAYSNNFPTTVGAYQTTYHGSGDAFVTELDIQGSALVYSTLIGGANVDGANAIALDGTGSAYVVGSTQSTDFPITSGAFATSKPSTYTYSAFVTKVNPGGGSLAYSSYLGGSNSDAATGIVADTSGNGYILGTTYSSDFPTTPGALKTQRSTSGYSGDSDLFISELDPAGNSLIYSSYFGTAASDAAGGIALGSNTGIYIAGETQSLAYPTTAGALQGTSHETASNYSGFITKIDFSSTTLCDIVLSSNSASFPGRGGTGSFSFTVANGCPWEITSDSFITVSSPHSGFGSSSVNYSVGQNQSTFSTMTGTIRVNGGTLTVGSNVFTVNQAGGSCTDPVFSTAALNFVQAGGIETVYVSLPSGCAWNLANVPPWITPTNSVNSSGSGTLFLDAAPNSFSARAGGITLATKTITVTEAAGSCTLSLSAPLASVPAVATARSVGLTTGSSCAWAAYSSVPWIQINVNSITGQGSGSVAYVVAANPGSLARAASLLIGDQTYQVTQAAGPVIPTSYTSALYTGPSSGFAGDGGPVGSASVWGPVGMVFDGPGNLYIADSYNARIRRVDTNGIITTFAGGGSSGLGDGGLATAATLYYPNGVAVSGSGDVYIADTGNNRIRKVSSGVITTIAGTGTAGYNGDNQPADTALISAPYGIVVDAAGNIYFADNGNNRIRKISAAGIISTVAGTSTTGFSGDGGSASDALINGPFALSMDAAGSLYFIDLNNYRIRKISAAGIITTVAGNGSSISSGDGGPATLASIGMLTTGSGLTVDASGSLYFSELDVRKITPDGIIQTISTILNGYSSDGLAVDAAGNVYEGKYTSIWKLTPVPAFCTFTVSKPPAQTESGGTFSLSVMATPSACAWSASSPVSWITVQTPNGIGSGSVTVTVTPNNSFSPRSGTLTVAGFVFYLVQPARTTNPGTATHFSVSAPATAVAGVPVPFTVTALDASNSTALTYSDPVHFTSTDTSATLPADLSLVNGVGTLSASLVTLGTQTLTGNDPFSPSISGTSGNITVSAPAGLRYVPVAPCRVADTRNPTAPFGAPFIAGSTSRSFTIPNSVCGIPASAQAYSLNVTVVPHGSLGYITVWPAGQTQPGVSTLNSIDGRIKANAAIVPAGSGGAISVFATDDTDVILDIDGYFVPASNASALAFYPMAPCRLVDTRSNLLSSGALSAGSSRTLPVLSSSCNVAATAQAYSLNFTVVPQATLGYISVWPTGQSQPLVSTLNDLTGTIVANAAIVPAGTVGSIDVYATDTTDLVVDINGYYAPAGAGGLSLYTLPPCRVLDTRNPPGSPPFTGSLDVNVIGSGCGGTVAAQAYVFNATVVPSEGLGYLTLWPQGAAQPTVSTLNALDGAITSNMAIVPTNTTEISAYASGPSTTHLILDISGYFAP
jgi:Beta-propeller repeat/NHL repeat/Putative binding domain, N-terminal